MANQKKIQWIVCFKFLYHFTITTLQERKKERKKKKTKEKYSTRKNNERMEHFR